MAEQPRAAHQVVCVAVVRQRQALLAMVRQKGRGRIDAEEVVHKGLQRALGRSHQLLEPAKADAWVAQIVRRLVLDELRHRKHLATTLTADTAGTREHDTCRCSLVQASQLRPDYADIPERTIGADSTLPKLRPSLGSP